MKLVHHPAQPGYLLFLPAFYRPKQNIFGRMLHINKFQHLDPVAGFFQQIRPDAVCDQSRHAFF